MNQWMKLIVLVTNYESRAYSHVRCDVLRIRDPVSASIASLLVHGCVD